MDWFLYESTIGLIRVKDDRFKYETRIPEKRINKFLDTHNNICQVIILFFIFQMI